jgi:decaprenyl-phosphate phosphoribosyltransferase
MTVGEAEVSGTSMRGEPLVALDRPRRTALRLAMGLAHGVRPRQWVKNGLVVAAPFVAGRLTEPRVIWLVFLAFVAFCFAASAVYLINDVLDAEADRAHPTKRNRPIASGLVPPRLAVVVAVVLLLAGLLTAWLVTPALFAVLAVYEVMQIAYCVRLKHEAVVDLVIVAMGFLLRAIAGGAAISIDLSQWFLLAAAFGSLFIVAGKRYSEHRLAEESGKDIRRSLQRYSDSYLRFVWSLSAAVLIMTYGLWAFELRTRTGSIWAAISMAPFVLTILRYAVDIDGARAGAPEEIALRDRILQIVGVAWVAALAVGLYL